MNFFNRRNRPFAIVVIGLLALMLVPKAPAQTSPYQLAPQEPNFYRQDTNQFPLVLTNAQSVTLTNALKLPVRQDRGLSIFVGTQATNTTSAGATLGFDVTYDGTNYTTGQPLTALAPYNSTNAVLWWTNWPRDVVNNVRGIKCSTVTNGHTNSTTITKLVYSYSGQ